MTNDDPITAVLDQLAARREQLAKLDEREAGHHAAITGKLDELATLIAEIGAIVRGHAGALTRLDHLEKQVTALAGHAAEPGQSAGSAGGYQPGPAPRWWKLTGTERQDAITRLRAWVDQVFRPGYAQLAAALGACWESHDLCLYGLDIAAELWSVLYLQKQRTPAVLTAQAEYQGRILPALAEQFAAETRRCGHGPARQPSAWGTT